MTKDLPIYKITIEDDYSDGENLGIEMIAFTNLPAIKVKGMAFGSEKKIMFTDDIKYRITAPVIAFTNLPAIKVKGMAFGSEKKIMFTDDIKYRITAPAMIPMDIYRKSDEDGEYYVQFTEEVIEQIHTKFMSDLRNRDIFNLEHDTDKKVPAYILETWIVDNPQLDKAFSTFGIDVPKGTLMVTAQVTDPEYYSELISNDQVGFSIEGFLGLKLKEQIKLNTMKLPDGEHLIEGKIYVVVNGEIVEIKDAPVAEEAMEDTTTEEEKTEEVAMEETTVEEETTTTTTDEEMAIDPATDAEAIAAIVLPIIEEREKAIISMIADLRNQMEEMLAEETTAEEGDVQSTQLSMSEKFAKFKQFVNQ